MLEVLEAERLLVNQAGQGYAERFPERSVTRFEARGQRLGHQVWDLHFHRAQGGPRA
jgi:tRNA (guanine-N7-)-methyltransferase